MILHITLPIPPTANHAYITTKKGQRVLTKKAKDWMVFARLDINTARMKQRWDRTENEKVIVEMWCWWPDKRRRDTHNLDKLLLDALEGVVFDDDRWALPRWMDFDVDKENPRVDIQVRRLRDG